MGGSDWKNLNGLRQIRRRRLERVIGRQIKRRSRWGGHGGFHGSIPSLSHTTVLDDDGGNGDLVASV